MFGYIIGLDKLPGIISVVGTGCALAGIMYIDRGARKRDVDDLMDEGLGEEEAEI